MNLIKFILCLMPFTYRQDCSIFPYNPDVDFDTAQIIGIHGYKSEVHVVVTDDGYVLKLHRIPGKGNGFPVFLQHGMFGSSADWVISGNNSLAFLLADQGYDVWMGNARGSMYSAAHVSIPVQNNTFWNFSWHEMGLLDLPAALNYIYTIKGGQKKIIYIGHSMGTTMAFVLASTLPDYASDKINAIFALAPIAYTHNITDKFNLFFAPLIDHLEKWENSQPLDIMSVLQSLFELLATITTCEDPAVSESLICTPLQGLLNLTRRINTTKKFLGNPTFPLSWLLEEFLGQLETLVLPLFKLSDIEALLRQFQKVIAISTNCSSATDLDYGDRSPNKVSCNLLIYILGSPNIRILPSIASHHPAGTSLKTLQHYAQGLNSEKPVFRPYTRDEDEIHKPLERYNLKDIKVPVHLIYSSGDSDTDQADIDLLVSEVKTAIPQKIDDVDFGHIDFVFGKRAYEVVYQPLLGNISAYVNK